MRRSIDGRWTTIAANNRDFRGQKSVIEFSRTWTLRNAKIAAPFGAGSVCLRGVDGTEGAMQTPLD